MRIITPVISGTSRLKIPELSREARQRLKWFDYYHCHRQNARLTCRHFDISPQTFYRWKRRYDARHLESLESRSRTAFPPGKGKDRVLTRLGSRSSTR